MKHAEATSETWTLDVPTAGKKYLGLSRKAAYEAAQRGDIPTIKVGRLLRVPVKVLEAKLSPQVKQAA